jgi:hypothetical protein
VAPNSCQEYIVDFRGGLITEMGSAQGTGRIHAGQTVEFMTYPSAAPRHRTSCRDAGPQYDQKVNKEFAEYPTGNGLSKRKQL